MLGSSLRRPVSVIFSLSSFISSFSKLFPFSQAASGATLPSAPFVERLSPGASWVSSFQQVLLPVNREKRKNEKGKPLNRMCANSKLSQQRGSPHATVPSIVPTSKLDGVRWSDERIRKPFVHRRLSQFVDSLPYVLDSSCSQSLQAGGHRSEPNHVHQLSSFVHRVKLNMW